MLRLKDITKNYKVAGGEIEVLKGLNVSFRKNEFVSILGPSGCGKTTTLNIVGGLDKYTSGDLIIAGKSTKNFSDRDWDIYRNQRIGFVFQSYNLIPHQTVLGNVELALTISGVSKEERVRRSLKALEKVGLKGEENKRPNQLSGGQCQRVAIARALVNEPDILLADEPTGALDSKTSVQIMDLIKEISKDKLVIMVTHNSEIAEQYSTRIVRLVDGEIVEDTNPFTEEDEAIESNNLPYHEKHKKSKAKMSWWTAFKLSAKNLFSKRGRTVLTSIAGSIGIIGISAVIAVSSGVRGYIDNLQDDMLSGNPITITEEGYDLNAMMNGLGSSEKKEIIQKKHYVTVDSMLEFLAEQYQTVESFMISNDINEDYIEYVKQIPKEQAIINFDYGIDVTNNIYTDFYENKDDSRNVSLSAIRNIYTSIMKETQFKDHASLIASLGDTFMQAIPDNDYILSQYDLKTGKIAEGKNEIMLVVNKDRQLTDLMLAQLGYYTQEEFINIAFRLMDDPEEKDQWYDEELEKTEFSYDELLGKSFTYYGNDTVYRNNRENPLPNTDPVRNPYVYNYNSADFDDDAEGIELKIVGILQPKENINFGCLSAGMYYTEALTNHILSDGANSQVVKYLNDSNLDSFNVTITNGINVSVTPGIVYYYTYNSHLTSGQTALGVVGTYNTLAGLMSNFPGGVSFGGGSSGSTAMEIYILSMRNLGGVDLANSIFIYAKDFAMKDLVLSHLDKWNDEKASITVNGKTITAEERAEIVYTDMLSLIIAMLNTMIDVITIALISFTSLALVVSCVMIAIITYVSVVERVKEIGVIRSLGGRKRDVSNLFNAETLVIGTSSGLIGVGFTYFISFIVNIIVKKAAGFAIMVLPLASAGIMMALSIGLTVLSGLIPARKAAHQDPVVALRTE